MKYRKKPVIIEAITFGELKDVLDNSRTYNGHIVDFDARENAYLIPTLEGVMKLRRGDMLITGVNGEIYPCKMDIFEKTYEPISEVTE